MTTSIITKGSTVYPVIIPTKDSLKSVNFYLVKNNNILSLIDAGYDNDQCWQKLVSVMNDNGFSITDLDQIILTHHHIDHIGLVNRILTEKIIPIYAHEKAIPLLKRDETFLTRRTQFYKQLYTEMGCGDTSSFYLTDLKRMMEGNDGFRVEGDLLPLSNQIDHFQVLETPGHATDHVVLFDEGRGWIFGGDLLLSNTSTNAIIEPDEKMNRLPTLLQYKNSLIKCASLDAEVVFPGHQHLIYNHKELIEKRLKRIDEKATKLLHLIASGITTASELAIKLYRNKYKTQFPLVMSEIIGHLDYLEAEEKVYSKLVDGIRHYKID